MRTRDFLHPLENGRLDTSRGQMVSISIKQLVGEQHLPEPIDTALLSECYLMFITALAEDDLLEDVPLKKQSDAFAAWFKQCNSIGSADPSILHDWLRLLSD